MSHKCSLDKAHTYYLLTVEDLPCLTAAHQWAETFHKCLGLLHQYFSGVSNEEESFIRNYTAFRLGSHVTAAILSRTMPTSCGWGFQIDC